MKDKERLRNFYRLEETEDMKTKWNVDPGLDPGTEEKALVGKNRGIWIRSLLTSINFLVLIFALWLYAVIIQAQ